MAVTENVIRTVVEIIGRGGEQTSARISRIHKQLTGLRQLEAARGRSFTGMRNELGRYVKKTEDLTRVQGRIRQHGEKMGRLSGREQRMLADATIQTGKYQKELMQSVVAKKRFREEMTRVQRRVKAFPKDIGALKAQQSLLNRAQQQGTISMAAYKKKIEPINRSLKALGSIQKKGIIQLMKWAVGWTIVYRILRGIVSTITNVIRSYMDLKNEMARVASVTRVTGESKKKTMDMLRDAVLRYTMTSIRSFKEVAEAMYHLGSAGLAVGQQLAGFSHILDLTTGTLGNIREVSRLVAGSFNIYGKQIKHLTTDSQKFKYISDLLAWTWSKQQVELSEINSAMTLVGSAGALLNIDYKVLIGTIGELNSSMLRGTRAGTSMLNAFIKIAQNSAKLRREFGLVFDPERPLDFVSIMTQLHERLGDVALSADNLRRLMGVFGIRGARAVGVILNRFNEWKKTVEASDATFSNFARNMRREIEDTLPRQLKKFGNLIKTTITPALETAFAPMLYTLKQINKWAEAKKVEDYAKRLGVSIKEVEFMMEKGLLPPMEQYIKEWGKTQKVTKEMPSILREAAEIERAMAEHIGKRYLGEESYKIIKEVELGIGKELNKITEESIRLLAERNINLKEALNLGKRNTEEEKKEIKEGVSKIVERLQRERIVREEIEKIRIRGASQASIANRELMTSLRERLEIIKELTPEQYKELEALGFTKERASELFDLTDKEKLARQVISDIIKGQNLAFLKIVIGAKELERIFKALPGIMKNIKLERLQTQVGDIGEAITKGWVGGILEWADIARTTFDALGDYARETITNALTGIPAPLGGLVGGIAGGLIAGLGALIAGAGKEQDKIREATLDVSAGIGISNEQLTIINRNLLDIRHTMEGYPMQKSFYFATKPGSGVQVQAGGIVINLPEGSDGEDVVKAIEESFSLAGSRVYQPS